MTAQEKSANNAMRSTLHSALGNLGGGQKSWMMSPNANSRPIPPESVARAAPIMKRGRGRPPKKPAIQSGPSVEPQVETHALSSSTSPQLANILTGHDRPHVQRPAVTVFPSPTPSEEDTHNPQLPSLRGGNGPDNLDNVYVQLNMAVHSRNASVDTTLVDTAQNTTSRQRALPEEAAAQGKKRRRPTDRRQEQPTTVVSASGSSQWPILEASRGPLHAPQLGPGFQGLANPPQAHVPFSPRHTTAPIASVPAGMTLGSSRFAHLDRSRQPDGWYTKEECLEVLDAFERSRIFASYSPLDRSRLRVLRDATIEEDWAYIAMHQFFCLLDHDPRSLPGSIPINSGLQKAAQIMNSVLEPNANLSSAVLVFCASFPHRLELIRYNWPVTFEQQTRYFDDFVSSSHYYEELKLTCERRRLPPLAWELSLRLKIKSQMFQRILYTAVLRSLYRRVPNSEYLKQEDYALQLFRQNQASFKHRLAKTGHDPPRLALDNQVELQQWAAQLRPVVDDLERRIIMRHHQQQANARLSPQVAVAPRADYQVQPPPQQVAQLQGVVRPHANASSRMLPSQPHAQQQRNTAPFFPPPGYIQPHQRQPNPARFSLHQADLRSPTLKAHSVQSPLYQYVQSFVESPKRLSHADQAVEKWSFTFDAEAAKLIAKTFSGAETRVVDENSKTVRLRCIKWPSTPAEPDEHTWITSDTSWIPHSYFSFNGTSLIQRKKVHHGKDLPIDLTHLIKEGPNTLEMTVLAPSNDKTHLNYLIAIELLGFTSHTAIKLTCLENNLLSAQKVLSDITHKLRSTSDDDIAIVESNLTITLFDPFLQSRICDTPVRSKACRHFDCFDLETFLQTRERKGDASDPDRWRCPICGGDARPGGLLVDGFMLEVKKSLERVGLADTRAIVVQQDGSWRPKVEVRDPNGVSDETPEPEARRKKSVVAEVIDLSD